MPDEQKSDEQEQLYVLRLWDGPPLPSGARITFQHLTLYHVGGDLRLRFTSLTALLKYLETHLDPRPDAPNDAPENPHSRTQENL